MRFNKKYKLSTGETIEIRIANIFDSKGIIDVWNSIVKEKIYTMGLNLINENEEIELY